MSVSNLTGTKWVFNNILTNSYDPSFDYGDFSINFTCNNRSYQGLAVDIYDLAYGEYMLYVTNTPVFNYNAVYDFSTGAWIDDNVKTIEIIDGTDATNPELIAWLQNNATQLSTTPTLTFSGDLSSYLTVKVNNVTVSSGYELSHGDKVELFLDDNYPDYEILINGEEVTDSEITVLNEDISIEVNEYSLYDAVLGNNDWATIQMASKNHNFPSSWQVGDTKTFVYNGVNYQARLVDTTGKYRRVSDNSIAYLKFELTELLPDSEVYHSSGNNRPLQSQLLDKMNNGTIYSNIDSSLTSVIEAVKVEVSQGGGSSTENTLVNFEGKFFLQREHDLFSARTASVQAEWNAISNQDEYYQTHNTDSDRKKRKQGSTSRTAYWEMSPDAGDTDNVCFVYGDGDAGHTNSNSYYGVALCFAL